MGIHRTLSILILALSFPGLAIAASGEQKVCVSATKIRVRTSCLKDEKPYSLDFLNGLSTYSSSACPAGPKGDTGSTGSQGDSGSAGIEAVGPSTIVPKGEIIFGAVQESHEACTLEYSYSGEEMSVTASLGAILPADPLLEVVSPDKSGNYNGVTCKGPLSNPTLPAGTICVFVTSKSPESIPLTNYLNESIYVYAGNSTPGLSRRTAFTVRFRRENGYFNYGAYGLAQFTAIWMYKAP